MDAAAWMEDVEARVQARVAPDAGRSPGALTVLFDPRCALCRRCRAWMQRQPSYVPLTFVSCTAGDARARYGDIPWLGDELIVVGDDGQVWIGPAAFLTCLWALEDWRPWSYRLAGPAFAPLAKWFFSFVSSHRRGIARLFEHDCADGACRV
ncbi:MAG TPA: DCC1-like thiol-disulfide oxidoreductase family protein [Polyangia bacterium]|nr:DCC1-like thiol-disulfide oxidoreductase family protein [Polyangia bacterium]